MKYFVSFNYCKGFGNALIPVTGKIENMEDIRKMQKHIEEKQKISGVVIISFQLIEGDK